MLKYFRGAPLKINLHEYLTHEYFHTRKFPDLRYIRLIRTTLSEYLSHNSTLPVASSIQYYFLPGEHHVPANMLLQDLCNFSRI